MSNELLDKVASLSATTDTLSASIDAAIARSTDSAAAFNAHIADLQAQVDALKSGTQTPEVIAAIDAVESTITMLKDRVDTLNATPPPAPPVTENPTA